MLIRIEVDDKNFSTLFRKVTLNHDAPTTVVELEVNQKFLGDLLSTDTWRDLEECFDELFPSVEHYLLRLSLLKVMSKDPSTKILL